MDNVVHDEYHCQERVAFRMLRRTIKRIFKTNNEVFPTMAKSTAHTYCIRYSQSYYKMIKGKL